MAAEDSTVSPASKVQRSRKVAGSAEPAMPVNCGLPRNWVHSSLAKGSLAKETPAPARAAKSSSRRVTQFVCGELNLVSVWIMEIDRVRYLMIFECKKNAARSQLL